MKETLRIRYKKGSRVAHCVKLHTPAKTLSADEVHARMNRRTDRRCACAAVDFGRDRRSDAAGFTRTRTNSRVSPAAVHQQGCWRPREGAGTGPTVQAERDVSDFSSATKWRISAVQHKTDNREKMPEELFQRVRTKARVAWKVVLYCSNRASICSHALILLSPTRWIVMTGWRTSISLQPVFKHVWIMGPCCIQASLSTLCFNMPRWWFLVAHMHKYPALC